MYDYSVIITHDREFHSCRTAAGLKMWGIFQSYPQVFTPYALLSKVSDTAHDWRYAEHENLHFVVAINRADGGLQSLLSPCDVCRNAHSTKSNAGRKQTYRNHPERKRRRTLGV